MPSSQYRRRHFPTDFSVQSSRRAISALEYPSLASSTILARSTSRCDRVYCPARRRSSRSSASLSSIRYLLATTNKVRRHSYDSFNQPGAYFRERPLAREQRGSNRSDAGLVECEGSSQSKPAIRPLPGSVRIVPTQSLAWAERGRLGVRVVGDDDH